MFRSPPSWLDSDFWICWNHVPSARIPASGKVCWYGCGSARPEEPRPKPKPVPLETKDELDFWTRRAHAGLGLPAPKPKPKRRRRPTPATIELTPDEATRVLSTAPQPVLDAIAAYDATEPKKPVSLCAWPPCEQPRKGR